MISCSLPEVLRGPALEAREGRGKATSAKKEDKKDKKKKKKEKKEKTTVEPDSVGPELALGDEIQKCPNLVRAMCHIFRVTTSDKYGFNRLKLVFEPKSGLAGIVGGHSGYKRPSLIFSNTSSSSPSRGWASLGFLDSVPATLFALAEEVVHLRETCGRTLRAARAPARKINSRRLRRPAS